MTGRPLRDALRKTLASHPLLNLAAETASNVVNATYQPQPGETMPAVRREDAQKILTTLADTLSQNGMTIAEVKPAWASKELWLVAVGIAGVLITRYFPDLDPATRETATMLIAAAALGAVGVVRRWFTSGPVITAK